MADKSLDDLLTMVEVMSPFGDNFRCNQCKKILLDPKQTGCGHMFCSPCLATIFSQGKAVCPVDKKSLAKGEIFKDALAKRLAMDIQVTCPYKQNGCIEKMEIKALQHHAIVCEYIPQLCPQSCQQYIAKANLAKHLNLECPYQHVPCQHCKLGIPKIKMQEHLEECYLSPMPCPYNCGQKSLPRHEMKCHAETCPARPFWCRYAHVGCPYQGTEELVIQHERDAAFHMELLFSHVVRRDVHQETLLSEMNAELHELREENAALRIKMEQDTEVVAVMMDGIQRLSKTVLDLQRAFKTTMRLKIGDLAQGVSPGTNLQSSQLETVAMSNVRDKVNQMCEVIGELKQDLMLEANRRGEVEANLKEKEVQLELCNTQLANLDLRFQKVEGTSYDGTFVWKIKDFWKHWETAAQSATQAGKALHSVPFYTNRYGYKLCLRLYPNGEGLGHGTHVSLFFVLMKGRTDDLLQWPFRLKVKLMLLDQHNGVNQLVESFRPDPNSASAQKPVTDTNTATGSPKFVSQQVLRTSPSYIVNDTMYIKVVVGN